MYNYNFNDTHHLFPPLAPLLPMRPAITLSPFVFYA